MSSSVGVRMANVPWMATALKRCIVIDIAGKGMPSHENHRTPVKCTFQVRSGTEILPCSMAQKVPWLWAQRCRSVPAEHISMTMTSGLPRPLLLHQTCWMLMTDTTEPMCL